MVTIMYFVGIRSSMLMQYTVVGAYFAAKSLVAKEVY